MRKIWLVALALLPASKVDAQFELDRLQIRAGYSIHNSGAKHFNQLISDFNRDREGELTSTLPSLNFQHGITFGAGYEIQDGFLLHGIVKNRKQFLEADMSSPDLYYQLMFRQTTVELGVTMALGEEKGIFSHYVGGGIFGGDMGVYYKWSDEPGFPKAKNMENIDHAGVFGLSVNYEARIRMSEGVNIFIRPVLQMSLPSDVRRLNAFLNPSWVDDQVYYSAQTADKLNRGTLNGVGIEAGVCWDLPALPAR